MTSNHAFQNAYQVKLDELRNLVRENQEASRGPRYWEEPKETTGPHDPLPGHAWDCPRRDRVYGQRGPFPECCSGYVKGQDG